MKHLIKIEAVEHGVLGVKHKGLDQQYCEAGEIVILEWQPDAKWGLQEAHYTDKDGNIVPIDLGNGKGVVAFMMPDKNITIGGTFKRFVIEDWTGRDAAFSIAGSFDVANLPTLDGFEDAGKVAFVKDKRKYATWDGYGWTYMDGTPVTPRYLTFTANEDGVNLAFFFNRNAAGEEQQNPNITFQKSTDGGLTWDEHTIGVYDSEGGDTSNLDVIALDEGESVMFKGVNSENFTVGDPENEEGIYVGFYLDGSAAASGDITSLINGVGGDATIQFMQFYSMFSGCTGLTQAPALPATTLASNCYHNMFYGCTSLTQAPVLPATTLASNCYLGMFYGCTSLTQAPVLPATTLASNCYLGMFYGCTSLTQAPALPATTLASDCYRNMFYGCTGLTQAPALPATTLASGCYNSMFQGCTGLTQAPALPATTLASNCYSNMFRGCTGLTQAPALPATTLASDCYYSMFQGCTSLTQAPALPATTLASDCYNSMFQGCTSLTQAPALPATTLARGCYIGMFYGCTGLTQAPALPATTLASDCYSYMFYGCTHITSHHVATLNNSSNVFQNNSSCASLTIHAETPPTIANNTITGLKADCIVYVLAASVDAYKAAQYWSERAAYIQAIP